MGTGNKLLGNSKLGPILPLFPAGDSVMLIPGPIDRPQEGFEVNGDGFNGPWLPSTQPTTTGRQTSVWPIYNPQETHFGLTFDAYGTMPPRFPFCHNVAIRPIDRADHITVRFDALSFNLSQNMRLVAHIGFINGRRRQATAGVQARLVVSDPGTPPNPSQFIPASHGLELLRIETEGGINHLKLVSDRGAPAAMLRIDVPLLVNARESAYADALRGSPYQIKSMVSSNGLVPQRGLAASVTFMIGLENAALSAPTGRTNNSEAVGVFGVRLVPESGSPIRNQRPRGRI